METSDSVRWGGLDRRRGRSFVAALLAAAIMAGAFGCEGHDQAVAGGGSSSPAAAVKRFADITGQTGPDPKRKKLVRACGLLSPEVRAGIGFVPSKEPSDANCAASLAIGLYYTGDTGDLPVPGSFRADVIGARTQGSRAVVDAMVTFQTDRGRRAYRTKVLTVRGDDGWRVATPNTLGITLASEHVDDAKVLALYNEFRRKAGQPDAPRVRFR